MLQTKNKQLNDLLNEKNQNLEAYTANEANLARQINSHTEQHQKIIFLQLLQKLRISKNQCKQ